jgi:serine/threonine protein kinase
VLARKEKGNHPSTDIWALGLILFLMVFQRYPF